VADTREARKSADERRRSERAGPSCVPHGRCSIGSGCGLTIEAIADHAGVGKATIYRWWPNKAAMVSDAMPQESDATLAFPTPAPRARTRDCR
jgi:hypothetical protein